MKSILKTLIVACITAIALPLFAQESLRSIQPPPAPVSLTPAERAVADINAFTLASYRSLVRLQRDGITLLWNSTLGLTPQQVCDALGSNAAALFRDHGRLTALVAAIAQDNGINPVTGMTVDGVKVTDGILMPTNAFTVNPDGTVTIDPNTPYVPQ